MKNPHFPVILVKFGWLSISFLRVIVVIFCASDMIFSYVCCNISYVSYCVYIIYKLLFLNSKHFLLKVLAKKKKYIYICNPNKLIF